jgi:hypothetical protein
MNDKYANLVLHTDVEPFEIVRVISDKTIEIRRMDSELDKSWNAEIDVCGFVGHCTNNDTQKWIIKSNKDNMVVRARLRKDGRFHSEYGKHCIEDAPRKHYDFNFDYNF